MGLEIRRIRPEELPEWQRACDIGFLQPPEAPPERVERLRRQMEDLDRVQGAFEDGRCVATFCSFAHEVTLPGGVPMPSGAITRVTVSPSHRRRGLLTRMMDADLRAAKDRGEPMASLIAAEYPIYGRYGFGAATWLTVFDVDTRRTRLRDVPPAGGRIVLTDPRGARRAGPALHERVRALRHGMVTRPPHWWDRETGEYRPPHETWTEPYYALYLSPEGSVDGLVIYRAAERWSGGQPDYTVNVRDLLAVSPEAERALWHYLCSIDWVTRVNAPCRAPDDLLPLLLGDARAARTVENADHLWLRPLDVPRMLAARSYPAEGSLVLQVRDEAGLAGGRFLLEAGPDGASCASTSRPAELSLDVSALGSLYLGDESAVRLAALGRIGEERAGAAALADVLLRTSRRPWCPDTF